MILAGKDRSTWRKPCPIDTLSTTSVTWTGSGLYLGVCYGRTATNHLSHCTAHCGYHSPSSVGSCLIRRVGQPDIMLRNFCKVKRIFCFSIYRHICQKTGECGLFLSPAPDFRPFQVFMFYFPKCPNI